MAERVRESLLTFEKGMMMKTRSATPFPLAFNREVFSANVWQRTVMCHDKEIGDYDSSAVSCVLSVQIAYNVQNSKNIWHNELVTVIKRYRIRNPNNDFNIDEKIDTSHATRT